MRAVKIKDFELGEVKLIADEKAVKKQIKKRVRKLNEIKGVTKPIR